MEALQNYCAGVFCCCDAQRTGSTLALLATKSIPLATFLQSFLMFDYDESVQKALRGKPREIMNKTQCFIAITVACFFMAGTPINANAECMSDTEVKALVDAYMATEPAKNPEGLSEADAVCSRAKVNALLNKSLGDVVGYKAGLTNPAVQKRFNYDRPVRGTLYTSMLLKNGTEVPAKFGARALFEADMLVRVSDEAINKATSPEEVLASIDQIIPFIELPDLLVEAPPKLTGPAINAINVGARFGIKGEPIAVPKTKAERAALLESLKTMVVVMSETDGAELDRGKGSDILEHPLNAVVWLANDLASEGLAMKKGDLISLGSFSKLLPPKPGLKVTVRYEGLPGAQTVSVSFK
jgi:2-keto-4-pentenoate hydratase